MRARMRVGVGIAAVLLGSGTAYSATPSSDGTFHGCVNNATGVLRVIDTSKSGALGNCITSPPLLKETPISWNGQGVPGARGPAGPQGVQGLQGVQGPSGPAGPGITELSDLQGLACTVGSRAGTVQVAVATNGSISMNCAAIAQCADGIDNDGDGAIDAADPDCSSASDDTEAAAVCVDGFPNTAAQATVIGVLQQGVTTSAFDSICPSDDQDWLQVSAVAANTSVHATLTATSAGDVNICVYSASVTLIECSTNITGPDSVTVATPSDSGATYLFVVLGASVPGQTSYQLVVTASSV